MILLFSIVVFILFLNPHLLIGSLTESNAKIASQLLLILFFSSVLSISTRVFKIILGIRLKHYIMDRMNLLGSIFRILSVFYFFTADRYDVVGYYLFSQIMTLVPQIFGFVYLKFKLHYDFGLFLKNFRFSKTKFNRMKHLALNSIFITITAVLFVELDLILIQQLYVSGTASIYAVALTILNFVRSIFGVIYGPFSPRFNHLHALGKKKELNQLYSKSMILTLPIIEILFIPS